MRILELDAPGALDAAIDALRRGPVVVQLTTVFAVVARGTGPGAAQLDAAKRRLPGKTYGALCGAPDRFWALAPGVPAETRSVARGLRGVFFRLPVGPPDLNTPAVRAGTHQGLQLGGIHGALARAIEADTPPDPALYAGARYAAPLASSWNLSGDPGGGVTDRDAAIQLSRERGIRLVLVGPWGGGGSYPILELADPAAGGPRVRVRRRGPGLEAALRALV